MASPNFYDTWSSITMITSNNVTDEDTMWSAMLSYIADTFLTIPHLTLI